MKRHCRFLQGLGVAAGIIFLAGNLPAQITTFEGATVYPVSAEPSRSTIVVEGGRIQSIAASTGAANANVVKLQGGHVYPAFIDSWTIEGLDITRPPDRQLRDVTQTAPANMDPDNRKGIRAGLSADAYLDIDETWKMRALQNGFALVNFAPGSGSIRGRGALLLLQPEAEKPEIVVSNSVMSMGFTPGPGAGYPGSLLGVIALTRQTLYDAQRYGTLVDMGLVGKGLRFEEDDNLAALVPVVRREKAAMIQANTFVELQRAQNLIEEFGLVGWLAGCREGHLRLDVVQPHSGRVIYELALQSRPSDRPQAGTPAAVQRERVEQWEDLARGPAAMAAAGVEFSFCSRDTGYPDALRRLREAIQFGLPAETALKGLTLNAAKMFGIDSDYGTLDAGKKATFVVFDKPFQEADAKVSAVVIDGKLIEVKN
ncbi:MAG: amidohydrolase family protein [Fimbriimonadaceae bacterium]